MKKIYKYDNAKTDTEDLVFHYSQERRLSRASQNVKDLYYAPVKKNTLLRTITGSQSNSILFITILLVILFVFFSPRLIKEKNHITLEGNLIQLSSRIYSDGTHIVLKKSIKGEGYYSGPVEIEVSIPQEEPAARDTPLESQFRDTHWVFFSLDPVEEFELSVPFAASKLAIEIKAGKAIAAMQLKSK